MSIFFSLTKVYEIEAESLDEAEEILDDYLEEYGVDQTFFDDITIERIDG